MRYVLVDRAHLENFIVPVSTFAGWGIVHEEGGMVLLRVSSGVLLDYLRRFQPAWATLVPPLSASAGRAPAALAQLIGARGSGAGTVRDLIADWIGDENFGA